MTAPRRFAAWFDALPAPERRRLGADFAAELFAAGLTVYRDDRFVPIAPSLSPEPIGDAELDRLVTDARVLLAAAVKVVIWTLRDAPDEAARLYHGFTPLEWRCLRADPSRLARVATARVDYFRGADGSARALELNATIPAMQGYSDLIAHAWIRHIAAARGVDPAPLVARAGSNTADLVASLRAHWAAAGRAGDPRVLIVSRRGDSQLGELHHYQRAFPAHGLDARHAWADEVEVDASGLAHHRGEPFGLLYRHIFARRVEESWPLARLLESTDAATLVLNPVVSPIEVKGLLALLGDREHPAARLLDDEEREVIDRAVPWTRVLASGPTTAAGGERVADLLAWTIAHRDRVVVKRSWDYGGKGVFLGPDADDEASRHKMAELYGVTGWADFIAAAAGDENGWVVQELVPPPPTRHLIVGPDGEPAWREVYVDVNAYANLGVDARPRGGVCRASGSRVVNIASGGGIAPLIPDSVIAALFP